MERIKARARPTTGDVYVGNGQTYQVWVLRILHVQGINTMLLTKWVDRIMSFRDNLTKQILQDYQNQGSNWERQAALIKGASPFLQRLRQVFPLYMIASQPRQGMAWYFNVVWRPG